MPKNSIFKVLSPLGNTLKGAKNKMITNELEPPPDDRRGNLFRAWNSNGRVADALLYSRWAPFGYPVGDVKLVANSAGIPDNRKNSRFNRLVSNFFLRSWLCLWVLYSYNVF